LRVAKFEDESLRERARARLRSHNPAALELNGWMPAAVLVLIYPKDGKEHLLLTVRSETVEHHKGQISLPGGSVHGDEDLETTALRETFEEVGILPEDVEILGRLDDLVTNSRFRVTPIVGIMHEAPRGFTPSPFEVAEVIEVPLRYLLDPENLIEEHRERDGQVTVNPAYEFEGYRVWGATARMLSGFLDLLRD
jgi:8-oxo-dGTP pyrophosphatase MutT (NUDIX family)